MFELMDTYGQQAVIKVIGIGGGGGNAVDYMVAANIEGVEFIAANTDAQVLKKTAAPTILQLGANLTKGLGAGADPSIGRQAAVEDRERIAEVLRGADMVFVTAGMGGGTGTGAAPIIAQVARDLGILTVAVVTRPFSFEGSKRMKVAEQGIKELAEFVDSIITVPNEKLLGVVGKNAGIQHAFAQANDVLRGAVQGIAELITRQGLINVDFADVKTVMSVAGTAMMGTASATGDGRAREAAQAAVSSPLLDDINIAGAKGLLVNITAGDDLTIGEFEEVGETVKDFAAEDATVVIGTVIDPAMRGEMRVTVVATGLGQQTQKRAHPYKVVKTGTGTTDYEELDTPTVIRKRRHADAVEVGATGGLDHLDIPAFLRRQAD
jgi:cell division protein FtsZ